MTPPGRTAKRAANEAGLEMVKSEPFGGLNLGREVTHDDNDPFNDLCTKNKVAHREPTSAPQCRRNAAPPAGPAVPRCSDRWWWGQKEEGVSESRRVFRSSLDRRGQKCQKDAQETQQSL